MGLPMRYLRVTLDLPNDDHQCQAFQEYMHELMPTFAATPWPGWELFLAAEHTPGRDSSGHTDDPSVKTYLHLWRVRDYNSLPYLMEVFDDNPVYQNLDAMVLREVQDFTQALPYNPQSESPSFVVPDGVRFFLQVTFNVVADPEALAVFDSFMTDCVDDKSSPMSAKFGWSFVHGSYVQTGLLRRYVHIWATHLSLPDPTGTVAWLTAQTAVQKALNQTVAGNPQWEVWEPVSYTE
ncbi:hypothetical protein [Telmatospirillum sp.]|uniref:hypothetical protein n=1 Tax=Telmatospirillum sp. TaxID=2079197 RepID=UPI00283BE225|nr:hypothetical protein [Telmatospirillum sp.]MDR3435529.1 hypothetical protein [Telmatospirillum sp.]